MSEAPERAWFPPFHLEQAVRYGRLSPEHDVEYVRADIHDAELKAAMDTHAAITAKLGEVAAQRDALKAAGEAVLDEFIGANEPALNALDAAISACEGGQDV